MIDRTKLSDLVPFSILQIDERRKIVAANTEAQMLLGHSLKSLKGHNLSEFVYHDSPLFELLDRASGQDGDVSAHGVVISGPSLATGRLFDVRLRAGP